MAAKGKTKPSLLKHQLNCLPTCANGASNASYHVALVKKMKSLVQSVTAHAFALPLALPAGLRSMLPCSKCCKPPAVSASGVRAQPGRI